jgi:hypothetical protein
MKALHRYFVPVVFIFLLSSCATDAIIIRNSSSTPKKMVVYYPSDISFLKNKDSLQAWDLTYTEQSVSMKDRYRNSLKIPAQSDTSGRTVTFLLKGKHEVTLHSGKSSRSEMRKITVVAESDTLQFDRMGNCWVYTKWQE